MNGLVAIDRKLFQKLQDQIGSPAHTYNLINRKASETFLPPHLAAIVLAMDLGINVRRFATPEDLAEIRAARAGVAPPVPAAPTAIAPLTRETRTKRREAKASKRRGTSVFVVCGRNEKINRAMFSFLRALGLSPMEWPKASALSRKGSPFIGQILSAAFQKAVAVVVLFTPDEEARLKPEFVKADDPPHESNLTSQPRPNVLFEAGMAFGSHPDNTILVQVGKVRPFSDIAGRAVVHFDSSAKKRRELSLKLTVCGCEVDETGDHWLDEGDFSL